jgi:DNA-binding CsgD family transcriptional regulator
MGASSSSPKTSATNGASSGSAENVTDLIGRLVSELESSPGESPGADGDVILDLTTDGVRCLIVRTIPSPEKARAPHLSPREREIARMVALGYPNKTIAAVLDISTWTVGSHLRRIFAKLQVPSRAAMVARLSADRLLEPPNER